ncbi:MAG TPA: hypothetical protein VIT38_14025 [Allosphingosinicella sp.]
MRKTAIFGICAMALVGAASVTATPPRAASNASGTKAERQICRTFRENGTRLGGYRACHTATEWAELRRQMKANVDGMQTRQAMNGPGQ